MSRTGLSQAVPVSPLGKARGFPARPFMLVAHLSACVDGNSLNGSSLNGSSLNGSLLNNGPHQRAARFSSAASRSKLSLFDFSANVFT
jgi:hypothetical protein